MSYFKKSLLHLQYAISKAQNVYSIILVALFIGLVLWVEIYAKTASNKALVLIGASIFIILLFLPLTKHEKNYLIAIKEARDFCGGDDYYRLNLEPLIRELAESKDKDCKALREMLKFLREVKWRLQRGLGLTQEISKLQKEQEENKQWLREKANYRL